MNKEMKKEIGTMIKEIIAQQMNFALKENQKPNDTEETDQDSERSEREDTRTNKTAIKKALTGPSDKSLKKQIINQIGLKNFGAEVRKSYQNTIPDNVPDEEVFDFLMQNPESAKSTPDSLGNLALLKKFLNKRFASKGFNTTLKRLTGDEEDDATSAKTTNDEDGSEETKNVPTGVNAGKTMAKDFNFVKSLGLDPAVSPESLTTTINKVIRNGYAKFKNRLSKLRKTESDDNFDYSDSPNDETNYSKEEVAKFYEDFDWALEKAVSTYTKLLAGAEGDTLKVLKVLKKAQLVGPSTTEAELEAIDNLVQLIDQDNDLTIAADPIEPEIAQLLKDDMEGPMVFQSFRNLFAGLFEKVMANLPEEELDKLLSFIDVDSAEDVGNAKIVVAGARRGRPPLSPEEKARRELERKEQRKAANQALKKGK